MKKLILVTSLIVVMTASAVAQTIYIPPSFLQNSPNISEAMKLRPQDIEGLKFFATKIMADHCGTRLNMLMLASVQVLEPEWSKKELDGVGLNFDLNFDEAVDTFVRQCGWMLD